MWYKYDNGEWIFGNSVLFPDGEFFEHDHTQERDGWKWYDVSPIPTPENEPTKP